MRSSSAGACSLAVRDLLRGEVPSGAGRPAVVRGHPFLAKSLLVGVLPDDISDEPVRHAYKGNGPHHPFHLLAPSSPGPDQESGQELGVDCFLVSQSDRANGWSVRDFFASTRMSPRLTPN